MREPTFNLAILPVAASYDPAEVLALVAAERPQVVGVIGDAMARPLAAAVMAAGGRHDLSSVVSVSNGGAPVGRCSATSASVAADGGIVLLGRGAGCINTGGEKVFPEEVEGVLRTHHEVADAVVVGLPDERWGEVVAAVVEPRQADHPPSFDDLQAHCRRSLAGYKVVRRVVYAPAPRTNFGKADPAAARALLSAR